MPPGGPAGQTAAWGDEPVAGRAHGSPAPGRFDGGGYDGGGYEGDRFADDGPFGGDRFDDDRFGDDRFAGRGYGGGFDDSYGPSEGMSSGRPARPEKRRSLPLVIGGALVAGIVLIGGGIGLSSALQDDPEPAAPEPTQAAPTPTPTPTKPVLDPVKLQSRATDPNPLTLKEVFGQGKFAANGHNYVRTAVHGRKDCAAVVGGKKLEQTLKQGECTQALRATYALTGGQLIGTVGVFNLSTEAAAQQAVQAAADKEAFLQALPTKKGITRNNGRGEALGTSESRGHYLLMTWVQRPDGKKINKKYHSAVRVFGAEMVKGSNLATALHYRETEGKPLQR